jgi:hypothetical protein
MRYPIQPGVCRYCGEEPDGDKFSFVDQRATRCNRYQCLLLADAEYDRLMREERERLRKIQQLGRGFGRKKHHRKVKGERYERG